ncbi:hypothetical protein [Streptomyces sp. NPDC051569]|uniref:hypothetical protein n=1 Tax=Streptomyces sp. NPDC051569 TaxID=3365661 RepID=UPI0037AD4798
MDMANEEGAAGDSAALYLQELAYFLSVHLDRGPGMLWPGSEHPAFSARDRIAAFGLLAAHITRLTGLWARTALHESCADATSGTTFGHVLIHQLAGAGNWQVSAPGGPDPRSFRCRLLPSEVLYIPPGWTRQAELADTSRFALTYLAPTPASGRAARALPTPGLDTYARRGPGPGGGW